MRYTYYYTFALTAALLAAVPLWAQSGAGRGAKPLSPSGKRATALNFNIGRAALQRLCNQPAYTHVSHAADTVADRTDGTVYSSIGGSGANGDFLPYEGRGSGGWRIGACGETFLGSSGTLSGRLQYAHGRDRSIGWSAMRQPELYLPYISTDSIGGDFTYDNYQAMGRYGFASGKVALAAELDFEGEQAQRLSDPRALSNNTWLRPSVGVAVEVGRAQLLAMAGYGHNKQHVQLRYWRPGEQDRFFVAYGFGLYDTRQSGVSFGKSRMYYIDEWRGALTARLPGSVQAGVGYACRHMSTEESDIYNLYESRTQVISPHVWFTRNLPGQWCLDVWASGCFNLRKGYENIIEEYIIDDQNNIYDFRTLDTQQNYKRNDLSMLMALRMARRMGNVETGVQGGVRWTDYEEKYHGSQYSISVVSWQSHVRIDIGSLAGCASASVRDVWKVAAQYTWQRVGKHRYDVLMENNTVSHLDFQHAFAPYAWRSADTGTLSVDATWEHAFGKCAAGVRMQGYFTDGNRKRDVSYTGSVGFASTAPMATASPDCHIERYGSATLYVKF